MNKPIIIIILITVITSIAFSQGNTELRKLADSLYVQSDWAGAMKSYTKLSELEPNSGRTFYRLGICCYNLEDYDGAISAYHKAVEIGKNPVVMYNLACAYNLKGLSESAMLWLGNAVDAGFSNYKNMETDSDLASLSSDERFKNFLKRAKINDVPCAYNEEYRKFDFWIGEWNVTSAGQPVGTSSIQLILGSCVIFENWTDIYGKQGKSFNVFDQHTNQWKQTWVDDQGTVTEFTNGIYADGKMVFIRHNIVNDDGSQDMRRLSFFNLGNDKVRQFSEVSIDGGKTWNTQYDFLYTRKQ